MFTKRRECSERKKEKKRETNQNPSPTFLHATMKKKRCSKKIEPNTKDKNQKREKKRKENKKGGEWKKEVEKTIKKKTA